MTPRFTITSGRVLYWATAALSMAAVTLVYCGVVYFSGKYLPNTSVDSIDITGLTPDQALKKISENSPPLPDGTLTLTLDEVTTATQSASLRPYRNTHAVLQQLYAEQHPQNVVKKVTITLTALREPTAYHTQVRYNETLIRNFIQEAGSFAVKEGTYPSATLARTNTPSSLSIYPGRYGRELEIEATVQSIQAVMHEASAAAEIKTASTAAELTEAEIEAAYTRAEPFVGSSIEVVADDLSFTLNDRDIIPLLAFLEGFSDDSVTSLITEWKERIARPTQEPQFEYDTETLEVFSFTPPRSGRALQEQTAKTALLDSLHNLEKQVTNDTTTDNTDSSQTAPSVSLTLPVETTEPKTSLADTNNLGIIERIGVGTSEYDHSIPNRIFNVSHTTEKINNHILAPGEEFSFNKTLGEVSSKTGFKSAYVIKNGQTELGDGGGVCQVSTTVFRAALNAGLNITRRLPHSYRVSYYELDQKPGVDATVYSGETDFRFINDTDHHILIHGEADSENLTMFIEIYGTSDGRTAEIIDHKTYNYRAPLPPEYYPDPSLPTGKLKQIDWSAAGITAEFTHVIKDRDGTITSEKTYKSVYRPWSAKFLQGI